jgi:hypothetical protein
MELAFKIAKGFFPVKVELPPPVPTRLLVPDDLSLSFIIRFDIALFCAPPYVLPGIPVPRPPATPAPSDPPLLVEEFVLEFDVLL